MNNPCPGAHRTSNPVFFPIYPLPPRGPSPSFQLAATLCLSSSPSSPSTRVKRRGVCGQGRAGGGGSAPAAPPPPPAPGSVQGCQHSPPSPPPGGAAAGAQRRARIPRNPGVRWLRLRGWETALLRTPPHTHTLPPPSAGAGSGRGFCREKSEDGTVRCCRGSLNPSRGLRIVASRQRAGTGIYGGRVSLYRERLKSAFVLVFAPEGLV